MTDRTEGLVGKFRVERLTPSSRGIDHSRCRYFVLDPQHDALAVEALLTYERAARREGYVALADDLHDWRRSLGPRPAQEGERAGCPEGCQGHGGRGVCPHCGDWHADDGSCCPEDGPR